MLGPMANDQSHTALSEPPFVGESRKQILDWMLKILDQVKTQQKAHLISFEAPTGWGKTRLAREFYKTLAARQQSHYWPASILEATSSELLKKPNTRRKRVFPQPELFNRAGGALPEFMWIGITCSLLEGEKHVLFDSVRSQLESHQMYLLYAWAANAGFSAKLQRHFNYELTQSELVDEGQNLTLESLVDMVADFNIPGIDQIKRGISFTFNRWLEKNGEQELIQMGVSLENRSAFQRVIDQISATISAYALPQLPMIVFIEDFH